jgi:hypothetical protein
MARASVELVCNVCGKTFLAEKDCYNRKEADSWEEWMQKTGGACKECWAKDRAQKIRQSGQREEMAQVEAWEARVGGILSALEGTEKQIAWAREIRHDILGPLVGKGGLKPVMFTPDYEKDAVNAGIPAEEIEKYREPFDYIRGIVLPLAAKRSAKWWIDNREMKLLRADHILTHWDEVKRRKERISDLQSQKPRRPERLENIFAGFTKDVSWNKKVYGGAVSGFKIYVANEEFALSPEEADALKKYVEAKDAWQKEYDALKQEDTL